MTFARSLRLVGSTLLLAGAALAPRLSSADATPPYTIKSEAPAAKAGAAAAARVEIKPVAGWHLNKDYPISLKLDPSAGLELPKPRLARADMKVADEHQLLAEVPFVAKEKGAHMINGTAAFAVCTNDNTSCNPQKVKVAIPVDVK